MVDETRTCPETPFGKLVLVDVDSMAWILCLESRSTASSTELNLSWRSTSERGKSLCLNQTTKSSYKNLPRLTNGDSRFGQDKERLDALALDEAVEDVRAHFCRLLPELEQPQKVPRDDRSVHL